MSIIVFKHRVDVNDIVNTNNNEGRRKFPVTKNLIFHPTTNNKMGVSASKPTETKVFTPSANIEYGQSLISNLEQSNETDYIRSQYNEIELEKRVNSKLDKLQKESDEFFQLKLSKALLDKDEDPSISSSQINDKISELSKILDSKNSKFLKLNDNVLNSKSEIVNCLIKNKSKPLNCWDEVKNFEKLVNEL